MTALTILTTEIRQLDGLYSLNDLHKAAGGKDKNRPTYFLRNEQTQELIAELRCANSHIIPTKTVRGHGKQQGTYVCKELVIAYAAWISASFHLKVIQVFLSQSGLNSPLERKSIPDHSAQIAEIEKIFQQQYRKLKKQYNYPRALLEQSYFASEKDPACLSVSMLTNTKKFISPLFGLLNELRVDGHDVSGPLAEAEALREALITVDDALNQIWKTALEAQHVSSSQAYGSEE